MTGPGVTVFDLARMRRIALQVPKPPPVPDGQLTLDEVIGGGP